MAKIYTEKIMFFWINLTNGSINRKIFGAAVTVGLLTGIVKILATVKELVVAWKFGVGDTIDAFLIALLVPAFILNLVSGSFSAALIPTYLRVLEKEGIKAAQKLFLGMTAWGAVFLCIITVLIVATAPLYLPLIARGFEPKKLDMTFRLLCAIAPWVPLGGMSIMWSAILNARERFGLAALSPILTPTLTIVFLLGFDSWGVFSLAAGLICGALLEMVILGLTLYNQGIPLLPKFYRFDPHLRQVAGQYIPLITGSLLICSAGIVDQSMAAMLPPGSVAALNYGNRLILSAISLIGTALNTAVIPYFSKMFASEDWTGLSSTLNKYIKSIFLFFLPLTGLIILLSDFLVGLTFQRGSFTPEATTLVSQIQSCYALQIPFYVANVILVRLITSMELNSVLMWISGLNLFINIILNHLFIQWFGVKGIALSTSCMFLFSFVYLLYVVKQEISKHSSKAFK